MYNKQEYILLKKLKSDELYEKLQECHAVIAGGAVRAVFANEYISDYDIYFKSSEDMTSFLKKMAETDFTKSYSTDLAKSFTKEDTKIQVIIMPDLICQDPKDIINQFDYSVCMGAYDIDNKQFILQDGFIEHIARRELYFNVNAKYPLASLFRLRKYLKKGYTISGTEIIKLGLSINNLKMTNYMELKKQLEGIDTLFLAELTNKLMTPEYAEREYDFNAFVSMIDEYFQDKLDELLD